MTYIEGRFFMRKNNRLQPGETALLAAVCVTLLTGVWAQGRQSALADKVVRLHVIAASDSAEDQRVKLEVRDALLAYLSPRLEAASGAQDAAAVIAASAPELKKIAETVSGGSARVELGRETYPTREYETFSLPAGGYTSLRVTLGAGGGRNWWGVVYPPLCTAGVETAQEAALSDDDIKLITGDGGGYVLRFRLLEWWGSLTGRYR